MSACAPPATGAINASSVAREILRVVDRRRSGKNALQKALNTESTGVTEPTCANLPTDGVPRELRVKGFFGVFTKSVTWPKRSVSNSHVR